MTPVAARRQRRLLALRIARLRAHLVRLRKRAPLAVRLRSGLEHGAMTATAALLAWAPTTPLGLHEGFWGALTAVAVVQTEFGAARTTARDQFTGASVGGLVAVATTFVAPPFPLGYVAAIVGAVVACWLLNVASAARLAGSTATILLLVPHTGSPERMLLVRIGEVTWGVACAIAVVGAATALGRRLSAKHMSSS